MKNSIKKGIGALTIISMLGASGVSVFANESVVPIMAKNDNVKIELYAENQENPKVEHYDVAQENNKSKIEMMYNDEKIESESAIREVAGVTMIPLRDTLEKMGYNVVWNGEDYSVDISKGAQWTSIKVGKNAYFKNRMAARPLSFAPVIIDGRVLVPAEFFSVILDKGVQVEKGKFKLSDNEVTIHSGYVKEIRENDKGTVSITIVKDLASESIEDQIVIHTSEERTYYNKEVKKGEFVNVISSMIMTMSIPPQTSGYIIY